MLETRFTFLVRDSEISLFSLFQVPIFSRKSLKSHLRLSIERFVSLCLCRPSLPPSDLTKEMETIHPEMGNDHSEDRRPGAERTADCKAKLFLNNTNAMIV